MSLLLRVHSAAALLTVSHSSLSTCSFFSLSHSSFFIRIGSEMWSEYLPTMDFSFQVERNSSSPSRRCRITSVPRSARVDRLDLELAGAFAAPAHAFFRLAAPARRDSHGDAVGDDEAGVEADAELADQVGVLLLVALQLRHELARAALGDGAQVRHRLLGAHADAVVADGQRLRLLVEEHADLEVGRVLAQRGVVQRLEAQLVAGVGGVGDQLAQEDLLVRVQRVGDEVQDLLDLGLEGKGLLGHWNRSVEVRRARTARHMG